MWQIVLVHRDGDCKTCLGKTPEEAKDLVKRVFKKYPNYAACFLPVPRGIIPTTEAKELADGKTETT